MFYLVQLINFNLKNKNIFSGQILDKNKDILKIKNHTFYQGIIDSEKSLAVGDIDETLVLAFYENSSRKFLLKHTIEVKKSLSENREVPESTRTAIIKENYTIESLLDEFGTEAEQLIAMERHEQFIYSANRDKDLRLMKELHNLKNSEYGYFPALVSKQGGYMNYLINMSLYQFKAIFFDRFKNISYTPDIVRRAEALKSSGIALSIFFPVIVTTNDELHYTPSDESPEQGQLGIPTSGIFDVLEMNTMMYLPIMYILNQNSHSLIGESNVQVVIYLDSSATKYRLDQLSKKEKTSLKTAGQTAYEKWINSLYIAVPSLKESCLSKKENMYSFIHQALKISYFGFNIIDSEKLSDTTTLLINAFDSFSYLPKWRGGYGNEELAVLAELIHLASKEPSAATKLHRLRNISQSVDSDDFKNSIYDLMGLSTV